VLYKLFICLFVEFFEVLPLIGDDSLLSGYAILGVCFKGLCPSAHVDVVDLTLVIPPFGPFWVFHHYILLLVKLDS